MKNLIVFSSPSGGGKSTLVRMILKNFSNFILSVSATTRSPRENEIDGTHYYFLASDEFKKMIVNNQLIEWEEIFGNYYGTPISEIQKVANNNKCLIFDIDVKGAISVKNNFPEETLLIFIAPPSNDVLINRLYGRKTETQEQIKKRVDRINFELSFIDKFDFVVINDDLQTAFNEIVSIIKENCNCFENI